MTFWQQRGEAGWGGRRLLWHTDLVSPNTEKEDEGWKQAAKPLLGMKDAARGFWRMRALLHTPAFIFKRRENGPQRLVILFSEEIDAGNREMLH